MSEVLDEVLAKLEAKLPAEVPLTEADLKSIAALGLTSCDFVGDSGCTDPDCWQCHSPLSPSHLRTLASNLFAAALLCRGWQGRDDDPTWRPGCNIEKTIEKKKIEKQEEASLFEVGEIINPEDAGLRVQITSLEPLEAVVVKNENPTSYVGKFFPVGRAFRFIRVGDEMCWRIDTDETMPWYLLGIFEGRKRFEHYR